MGSSSDDADTFTENSQDGRQSLKKVKLKEESEETSETPTQINYLAYIAHEVRNQLTGFQALESIEKKGLGPKDQEFLEIAQAARQSLFDLVNRILQAQSLKTGQIILQSEIFNPVAVAEAGIQELSQVAKQKNLELKMVQSQIPDSLIGDGIRFKEIMFNLVLNAIKYTTEGRVQLKLSGTAEANYFQLKGTVQDTGPGIPLEIQKTLFQPYCQATTQGLNTTGGTGLGLFITKELCKRMQGDVYLAQTSEQGSTFCFEVRLNKTSL